MAVTKKDPKSVKKTWSEDGIKDLVRDEIGKTPVSTLMVNGPSKIRYDVERGRLQVFAGGAWRDFSMTMDGGVCVAWRNEIESKAFAIDRVEEAKAQEWLKGLITGVCVTAVCATAGAILVGAVT